MAWLTWKGVAFLDLDFDEDQNRMTGRYYTDRKTTGDMVVSRPNTLALPVAYPLERTAPNSLLVNSENVIPDVDPVAGVRPIALEIGAPS
jgi:hypothetical protein